MPTNSPGCSSAHEISPIATRRILRLALGMALAMGITESFGWMLSFVAPLFTVFLLTMPMPVPSIKTALSLSIVIIGAVFFFHLFVPFLDYAPLVGLLLVGTALFCSFYYAAMGGNPLVGMAIIVSISLLISISSVSIDLYITVSQAAVKGLLTAFLFCWVAHALLPDLPGAFEQSPPPQAQPSDRIEALRVALRALTIVFPVIIFLLCSNESSSYLAAIVKISQIGQQSSADTSKGMGRTLVVSTIWGGIGAIIVYLVIQACPLLMMYILLIGLAGLLYGTGIFKGSGMHPDNGMWQYALVSMIIIIGPTVGAMDAGQDTPDRFWQRQCAFIALSLYGAFTVAAFNAFWPGKNRVR